MTPPTAPHAALPVRLSLSLMMFLQYFVWGAWFVTLGTYMGSCGFSGTQIGAAYGTGALAAIISPFFVGMIADRFFSTQKILAVLHILGAVLLGCASQVHNFADRLKIGDYQLDEFLVFYGVLLVYFLCYMPTLALTNSLSFHHLSDPGTEFPEIRVWGTIGWIDAGLLVGLLAVERSSLPMQIAALASAHLGVYCLLLPDTPPKNAGRTVTISEVLGLDALKLLKEFSFLVFVVGAFLICIPLQFYYAFANAFLNEIQVKNAAAIMTLGQMSEILFMLLMPLFFARLGVKSMLLVGMLAWAIRYALFAYGDADAGLWMLLVGIALHGICYDFFFVTAYIYVDQKAPSQIRGAAQGFIAFVMLGLGGFIGTLVSGATVDRYKLGDALHDWRSIWLVPAAFAGAVMVLFALLFHERKQPPVET